jgi:sRNA-binding regulator protein Hfq
MGPEIGHTQWWRIQNAIPLANSLEIYLRNEEEIDFSVNRMDKSKVLLESQFVLQMRN